MKYAVLNAVFLVSIVVLLISYTKKLPSKATYYTLIAVILMTLFFDSIIVSSAIVGYTPSAILGIYVWHAPLEDFAYAIASVLMVGVLWDYYDKK